MNNTTTIEIQCESAPLCIVWWAFFDNAIIKLWHIESQLNLNTESFFNLTAQNGQADLCTRCSHISFCGYYCTATHMQIFGWATWENGRHGMYW